MSPSARDPYVYPGTNILINLEDIRDQAALNCFEAQTASANIARLAINPIQGTFDVHRLQETHRRILGKNRSGFVVAYGPSQNVPGALESTFAALKAEKFLHGLKAGAMAQRLAYYYSELDAIHAFRDGNSRTLRAFTADLAEAAGHRLDWTRAAQAAEDRQRLYCPGFSAPFWAAEDTSYCHYF
jgi:cell filamentation protein